MTPTISLGPEDRRQLAATRDTLARLQAAHDAPAPITGALAGIELALKLACPHNGIGRILA